MNLSGSAVGIQKMQINLYKKLLHKFKILVLPTKLLHYLQQFVLNAYCLRAGYIKTVLTTKQT